MGDVRPEMGEPVAPIPSTQITPMMGTVAPPMPPPPRVIHPEPKKR